MVWRCTREVDDDTGEVGEPTFHLVGQGDEFDNPAKPGEPPTAANKVLQVMVRGVTSGWSMPVAYFAYRCASVSASM